MNAIHTETFTLPSRWASYILNRDASGLSEADRKEADDCLNWIHTGAFSMDGGTLFPVSVESDETYADENDWSDVGGLVSTYVFEYGPLG